MTVKKSEHFFKKKSVRITLLLLTTCLILITLSPNILANAGLDIELTTTAEGDNTLGTIEVMVLLTTITLLPSMLLLMTSFTRIVIVLSFVRQAIGTQQTPPNQVLLGLALFLSLFIMTPVISEINTVAYEPYVNNEITTEEALSAAQVPLKEFMLKQTHEPDLDLFLQLSRTELPPEFDITNQDSQLSLGLEVIVPAFVTSELRRAFTIGFLLFIPFLIVDIVVASTLMSMGMMMLPPSMISLPFKLLIFVLVDGWGLIMEMLAQSFIL